MAEGPTILGSESRSFTFSQYYSIKTNRSTSTRCKVVMDVMVFYKSRLRIKEILYGQLLVTTGLEQGRLKLLVADWAAQLNTFEQKMLPCKSKCLLCKLDSFSLFSMFTSYIFTLSRSKETHLQGFFRRLDVSVTGLKSHLMSAQHVEDFVKPLPLKLLVAHLWPQAVYCCLLPQPSSYSLILSWQWYEENHGLTDWFQCITSNKTCFFVCFLLLYCHYHEQMLKIAVVVNKWEKVWNGFHKKPGDKTGMI